MTKTPAKFTPAMTTMPAAGILCIGCQGAVKKQINRQWKGFFTCQDLLLKFSQPQWAIGKERKQACSNCCVQGG